MNRFKTLALAATAAAALSVVAAPQAEARPRFGGALIAGLVIGGAAASIAAHSAYARPGYVYGECYTVRRWVDTPYGPAVRRVRVCD
ncbi:hypothetical protein [Phreatobacter sp.]|uniref:hypothetical protein n=1 Tax=Phreatobacter sp. TaxID=1966341 RepID=UPI003F72E5BD